MSLVEDPAAAPEPIDSTPPSARRSRFGRYASSVRAMRYVVGALLALVVVQEVTHQRALTAPNTWASALQLTMPIALAGLGGLWSERAGIVNIGLEGMMALGTWFGAFGCIRFGPWIGILFAVLGGAAGGLVHAIATVSFGVDQIVSGVAINILGAGLTQFLNNLVYGSNIDSPQLPANVGSIDIPILSSAMNQLGEKDIFFLSGMGRIVGGLTTDVSLLIVLGLVLFPLTWWVLWRTPFGLRLRSVGEDPEAAESLGIKVMSLKYVATMVSGGMAGLGGATLVYVFANQFQADQTNGRGFIGLAAMIFGNWRPGGTLVGAGLFGLTDAMRLQDDATAHALLMFVAIVCGTLVIRTLVGRKWRSAASIGGAGAFAIGWYFISSSVPAEVISFLPHLTTLVVLAFAAQRLRPPAADGKVYRRGQGR